MTHIYVDVYTVVLATPPVMYDAHVQFCSAHAWTYPVYSLFTGTQTPAPVLLQGSTEN